VADFLGLYGKVPSRGDFISRGLSREFIDPWDGWLQNAIASSKQRLGESWLNHYLTSPLWRFGISGGICGANACFGVMMPSVDRVGRYFPLTLVQGCNPAVNLLETAPHLGDWFIVIEELALRALDDNLSVDDFHAELQDLPFPPAPERSAPDQAAEAGFFDQGMYRALLSDAGQLDSSLNRFQNSLVQQCYPGITIWTTTGSDTIPSSMLIFDGLPETRHFSALLSGDWMGTANIAQPSPIQTAAEPPAPPDQMDEEHMA
jgi:type VI secretion system protein ImpM